MQQEQRFGPPYQFTAPPTELAFERNEAFDLKAGADEDQYLKGVLYSNPITSFIASMQESRTANEKFWQKHFDKMSAGQEKLALFRLQPTMDDQFHLKPRFNDDYNKQKEAEVTKPRVGGLDAFLKAYEGK